MLPNGIAPERMVMLILAIFNSIFLYFNIIHTFLVEYITRQVFEGQPDEEFQPTSANDFSRMSIEEAKAAEDGRKRIYLIF